MSQKLIDELSRENLCTHFVLPLLRISKFSFISSNFVDSYIEVKKDRIVVKIIDLSLESRKVFRNTYFKGVFTDGTYVYLAFKIPPKWLSDVGLFLQGKFSQMSESCKEEIRRYSGLEYRVKDPSSGRIVTDGRLQALDKSQVLRDMWDQKLTYVSPNKTVVIPSYVDNHMELLSIPDERTFIDLSLLTQIKEARI